MLNTEMFGDCLKQHDIDFFSGVPCSYLSPLINYAHSNAQYIAANNEGDAAAICAGAYLGGKTPALLCQNSGMTNALSPLTSLHHPYKMPCLAFVGYRGEPGLNDAAQHHITGQHTRRWLNDMGIATDILSADITIAQQQIAQAKRLFEQQKSTCLLIRKNTLTPYHGQTSAPNKPSEPYLQLKTHTDSRPTRLDVLQTIATLRDQSTFLLSCTGYTSRELATQHDDPKNFYMAGSMGCINALGLGLALAKPNKQFIAIDGDGALLMRLGAMASSAYYQPKNLLHLVLDNECHESTGGQISTSIHIDFVSIAAAMPYTRAIYLHNLEELAREIKHWQASPQLTFLHLKIKSGTLESLARPSLSLAAIAQRFKHTLITGETYASID